MYSSVKRMAIRLLVLAAIVAIVIEVRHFVMNVHPRGHADVQRVTLVSPRPEPPRREPEIEKKPLEAEAVESKPSETAKFFKYDEFGPSDNSSLGPDDRPPGPPDDILGLATVGRGGSDSYGLVGKRGGRDITTLGTASTGSGMGGGGTGHGQGGSMAKFAGYATLLKDLMTAELNRRHDLKKANYEAIVLVWIGADGRISRMLFSKPTGVAKIDKMIGDVFTAAPALPTPPPADMPQPIHLKISSERAKAAMR